MTVVDNLNEMLAARGDRPVPLFAPPGPAPRSGSLFSGYGGLDRAVHAVFGGSLAWYCEIDPGASAICDYHWPDVPNIGDITQVDWNAVEPVEILAGGFPCQDVSSAGRQAGMRPDTRSGLWAQFAYAISKLRPRLVVIENVRGLLSARGAPPTDELLAAWDRRDAAKRALALVESKLAKAIREGKPDYVRWHRRDRVRLLRRLKREMGAVKRADARIVRAIGTVLGDLARLGFHAEWVGVRASDVGAPHARFRVFIIAWPVVADAGRGDFQRRAVGAGVAGTEGTGTGEGLQRQRRGDTVGDGGPVIADPGDGELAERARPQGREGGERSPVGAELGCGGGEAVADPDGAGCEGPGDGESAGRPASAGGDAGSGVAADPDGVGPVRAGGSRGRRPGPADDRVSAVADALAGGTRVGRRGGGPGEAAGAGSDGRGEDASAVADTDGRGRGTDELDDDAGESDAAWGDIAARVGDAGDGPVWGDYEPAIRRWELITGRSAPAPTIVGAKGGQILAAPFVEWLMGLPLGWVTGVPGLSRNDQLRALGNGVVWQQAAAALRVLLDAAEAERAA